MALLRILVDGYSLLHQWRELAPGEPRFSAAARDELVHMLTQYQDAVGTPITVFFDGQQNPRDRSPSEARQEIEILFSRAGQTADQMIERVAHRMRPYGEVLVVTDDIAERETVLGFGGSASSCSNFILSIEQSLGEAARLRNHRNQEERRRFQRNRSE